MEVLASVANIKFTAEGQTVPFQFLYDALILLYFIAQSLSFLNYTYCEWR